MIEQREQELYRVNPDMMWVVEEDCLVLLAPDEDRPVVLGYPESALWDFLSRCLPLDRIVAMMSAIMREGGGPADKWISDTCTRWHGFGWLVKGDGPGKSVDNT